MKRFIAALLALILLAGTALADAKKGKRDRLVGDLYRAFFVSEEEAEAMIEKDLKALDYDPLLTAVARHWQEVFLDEEYPIYDYLEDDPSSLEIEEPSKHAFVVMGLCLNNGEMEEELKLRCKAAARIANAYPGTVIVCTGGRSGERNPYRHTEAGLMRDYLTEECGIPASRIYTDEVSRATNQNVTNTFAILREKGIRTMTVVTSVYHIRWATVLFWAAAEMSRLAEENPYELKIIGNWCIDVRPPSGYNDLNALIASTQLNRLLGE